MGSGSSRLVLLFRKYLILCQTSRPGLSWFYTKLNLSLCIPSLGTAHDREVCVCVGGGGGGIKIIPTKQNGGRGELKKAMLEGGGGTLKGVVAKSFRL